MGLSILDPASHLGQALRAEVRQELVVLPHQLVGDGHELAEHRGGRLGDTNVVAQ